MSRARGAAVLGAALLASACNAPGATRAPVQLTEGRPAMGTILEITLVARDETAARVAIERCFREIERLEMIFTTWREDGELARLNTKAGRGPQRASPELVRILRDAHELAGEAPFDVTVGPLVAAWRAAAQRGAEPSDAELAAARARTGRGRTRIDASAGTVALDPGSALDLGGIAKGWALDRVAEQLRAAGIANALLDFGGSSIAALGAPLDAGAWRVALAGEVVELAPGTSVSISESFGQTLEIAGRRFSHIVDPSSGRALERDVRVVAFAPTGALAEVWSTALVVELARSECASGTRAISRDTGAGVVRARVTCAR